MTFRPKSIFSIAHRDLLHGWQAPACLSLSVAVALLPLMLLFALKFGVVNNMIESLRDDPRVREIRLVRDLSLSQAWFDDLAEDSRVAFLLPRARYLASSVRLRSDTIRRPLDSRMIPTQSGDPYLQDLQVPNAFDQVVLTTRAALELDVTEGDQIELIVQRIFNDERQRARLSVKLVGIVPRDLLQTDDIFVSPALENAVERWREGFSVPALGWEGARDDESTADADRSYASFRLFARDVRDVPGLRDHLLTMGLDVETRASAVEAALEIETGLTWIFLSVSTLASIGFLLTLGLHLAAAVVEKSRELSVLRLLGFTSLELSCVPTVQGMIISCIGAIVASGIAVSVQPQVNHALEGLAGLSGDISALKISHLMIAIAITTLAGGLAGCAAGYRAARLEPAQGLRYE